MIAKQRRVHLSAIDSICLHQLTLNSTRFDSREPLVKFELSTWTVPSKAMRMSKLQFTPNNRAASSRKY